MLEFQDMVRHQCVGAHALVQPAICRRMPRIDRVDLCFHPLAVATGMPRVLDIVQVEHGEGRHRIRDGIVGGVQGFQAQVIPRRRQHRRVPQGDRILRRSGEHHQQVVFVETT